MLHIRERSQVSRGKSSWLFARFRNSSPSTSGFVSARIRFSPPPVSFLALSLHSLKIVAAKLGMWFNPSFLSRCLLRVYGSKGWRIIHFNSLSLYLALSWFQRVTNFGVFTSKRPNRWFGSSSDSVVEKKGMLAICRISHRAIFRNYFFFSEAICRKEIKGRAICRKAHFPNHPKVLLQAIFRILF